MKKNFLAVAVLVVGVMMISVAGVVNANPINVVDYSSLTGIGLITFDDVAGGPAPGTNYDNLFESDGAMFGEHFAGQTLSYNGNSDVLSGAPTGGTLNLVAGSASQNLNVFNYSSNVLTGLGPLGFPDFDAIGEGAISLVFDNDQSEFGFQLLGGDMGSAYIYFYARNASLIDTIQLNNLSDSYYGFSREGGVNDIAGISIYNLDGGGIGFDNLKHDVPGKNENPVPEPSTMLLLGIGVAVLTGIKFKKK
ncbi:PEP-CTERM sorting domain-containing protein [Candidatus Desantisbacteria bacterium]|nr:PEP-CTERM sorting domain-containing protein [Candidatus Desantisbacteria bacterium]